MRVKVKAFGITKDILGGKESVVELEDDVTVGDLRRALEARHPELAGLRSLFIAVNHKYAEDHEFLNVTDEIALIPPVSGG